MSVKPIVVIPYGLMSPDEFEQSKPRLEAAGYVVLRAHGVSVTDQIRVLSAPIAARDSRPSWICEFCYARAYVSTLPPSWYFTLQSAVCGDCKTRVARDGGYGVVRGGAYAEVPDPRPWPA